MKVSIGEIWLAPGKTTYFEDRRFESTVIFDDRIKPNFVKVETALAALVILARN